MRDLAIQNLMVLKSDLQASTQYRLLSRPFSWRDPPRRDTQPHTNAAALSRLAFRYFSRPLAFVIILNSLFAPIPVLYEGLKNIQAIPSLDNNAWMMSRWMLAAWMCQILSYGWRYIELPLVIISFLCSGIALDYAREFSSQVEEGNTQQPMSVPSDLSNCVQTIGAYHRRSAFLGYIVYILTFARLLRWLEDIQSFLIE